MMCISEIRVFDSFLSSIGNIGQKPKIAKDYVRSGGGKVKSTFQFCEAA